MTPQREYAYAAALGVLSGAVVTLSAARPWLVGDPRPTGLPTGPIGVTGADATPLVAALGPVLLAGALAVLATRAVVRRVCGVVVAVAAAAVGVQTILAGPALSSALAQRMVGGPAAATAGTPWRWLCLAASAAACLFGALVASRGGRWPALGARYDAPSSRRVDPDEPPDLWRALDRGHDPTTPH